MKRALTIAGSDSSGGAGIQADIKTFSAMGVYAMSVLTAITAQNTVGLQGVFGLPPDFVRLQIDSVMSDIGADSVKTGMLANAGIIEVVADRVRHWGIENLVVDPVMVATSGDYLLQPEARDVLIRRLLPLARVVTPNLNETGVLIGLDIQTVDDMRQAAIAIHKMGPRNVVVKGGHLEAATEAIDILFDGQQFHEFSSPRVAARNTHGTGCTFASAIAAGLAKGQNVPEAVRAAKDYLAGALCSAQDWHLGQGHGPVDHFWFLPPTFY